MAVAQQLPGDQMRIGLSNIGGAWDGHYATMDLDRFGGVVDRLDCLVLFSSPQRVRE